MTTETVAWVGAVGIVGLVAGAAYAINMLVDKFDRATDDALALLEQFNANANILLDDDRTPVSVAEFVVRLSQELGRARLALWFISYQQNAHTIRQPSDFSKDLEALPADLVGPFVSALLTALFASASENPAYAAKRREGVALALQAATARHVNVVSEPIIASEPETIEVVLPPAEPAIVLPKTQVVPEEMQRAVVEYNLSPRTRARSWVSPKREPVAA